MLVGPAPLHNEEPVRAWHLDHCPGFQITRPNKSPCNNGKVTSDLTGPPAPHLAADLAALQCFHNLAQQQHYTQTQTTRGGGEE